jgi:hypothetical protein
LYILNARLLLPSFGEGYPRFSSPNYVENNFFNGFFFTVATGRSFCEGLSLEKGWFPRLNDEFAGGSCQLIVQITPIRLAVRLKYLS